MDLDFPEVEQKILKYWKENKIFEKLRKKNQGKKPWSFLDGPITANNPMGVHHAWGRTYKDLFQRYKAMQGFDQRFQNGFDCQGLWVEVEVEKELGFKTKRDIENYGIDKFVQMCKERVWKYSKIQTEQSIRLGQWMDWENSYYTMSDENNYSIWHFLKTCWQKGLLYKGRDVVPWCWRCGTAISQHEILTEEYKEISHKAIYFKLPIIGRRNTFFLVWTTTPWTLPANVALAVHPEFEYAEIENEKGEIFILLKEKASLIPQGKILKIFKGEDLIKLKYEGLFDELPAVKESLREYQHGVILWKDVSLQEGTGIVHTAPGCGQEDFQLSKEMKIPVINPLDDESRYLGGFGFLTGKHVTEVRDLIFEDLERKGRVFKIEDYLHRYPTCWRCKSELIFRLVDEWYIAMGEPAESKAKNQKSTSLRDDLIEVAKSITWIPEFGLEREIDWLKNMQDWLISKKRYWGLALPIYECPCGNFEVIGSKEELKERAVEGWDKFEGNSPHRPWVDNVKIKCSKCNQIISRIPDVGNPWLDAGIVSFSTLIDPETKKVSYFDDKIYWKKWFPADLICESFPGQFKNWFYSLIVMSTVLENNPPSKTIFGYATVRDEKGEEMHKSKGNAIWFDEAVEKIGADPMRWMYARQNPADNLKFGYNVANEIKRKLLILWNSYSFFETYVSKKEFSIFNDQFSNEPKNLLDKWIVSKINNLIKKVTDNLDKYNAGVTTLAIEYFFIEDLSLWYIRRSRKRLQKPENEKEKKEATEIFYYVLINLVRLIAPIMPFFAEYVYQNLKSEKMPESIHLFDWPKVQENLIDEELEAKMDRVREIVNLGLQQRASLGIKVRQPLALLKVQNLKSKVQIQNSKELLGLVKEELNVKDIIFDEKIEKEVELDTTITNDLKEEGILREIIRNIQAMRKKAGFKPGDKILVQYSGEREISEILEKNKKFILEETKAENFGKVARLGESIDQQKEIKFDNQNLFLGIKKIQK
jgi:isoleucyl-tRNA synthetase